MQNESTESLELGAFVLILNMGQRIGQDAGGFIVAANVRMRDGAPDMGKRTLGAQTRQRAEDDFGASDVPSPRSEEAYFRE